MGIYILFALLLLPAAHTQIYRRNIFDRILRNGYCDTVKQQPRWLFGDMMEEPEFVDSVGMNITLNCNDGDPMLEMRCHEGFKFLDDSQFKSVTLQDGIWPELEDCFVNTTDFEFLPSTGRYYKNVYTMDPVDYYNAAAACEADNINAVVAFPITPEVIWLLNATRQDDFNGGWINAQKLNSATDWEWIDGSPVTEFNWCRTHPKYELPGENGPWCIYVNSCWTDFPCKWHRESAFCQIDHDLRHLYPPRW